MKTRTLEIAVFVSLFICVLSSLSFDRDCEDIRQNLLRLHVIASGDTQKEQELKLKIRDAILSAGADIFSENDDLIKARSKAEKNIEKLQSIAESTLRSNGYTYPVEIEVAECYFPTRQYENITLPAGKYNAIRVIIGEGKGKNWWCVMFPPMCLPAAKDNETQLCDVLGEKSMNIVENGKKYEVRLWILEKWYELRERVASSQ